MKKINLAIIIIAIFATSCEKTSDIGVNYIEENNNVKYKETGDAYDYVFLNPKWEIINDKYEDEFGNIGKMYINSNNVKEHFFEILTLGNSNKAYAQSYKGQKNIYFILNENGEYLTTFECEKNATNKNCEVIINYDDDGAPQRVEMREILDTKH